MINVLIFQKYRIWFLITSASLSSEPCQLCGRIPPNVSRNIGLRKSSKVGAQIVPVVSSPPPIGSSDDGDFWKLVRIQAAHQRAFHHRVWKHEEGGRLSRRGERGGRRHRHGGQPIQPSCWLETDTRFDLRPGHGGRRRSSCKSCAKILRQHSDGRRQPLVSAGIRDSHGSRDAQCHFGRQRRLLNNSFTSVFSHRSLRWRSSQGFRSGKWCIVSYPVGPQLGGPITC